MITAAAAVALVGVHLFSFHTKDDFRTLTPGVYVKWDSGITAGVVLNSHGDPGAYGAYTFETCVPLPVPTVARIRPDTAIRVFAAMVGAHRITTLALPAVVASVTSPVACVMVPAVRVTVSHP